MRLGRSAASLLVPLLLVSPMISVGPYGVSVAELLVVLAGAIMLIDGRALRVPIFLVAYLVLFTIGRITSLINAPAFGIPVGMERVSFLYLLALPILAYLVGRRSARTMEEIATSRLMAFLIVGIALFATAYPFLDPGVRRAGLYWFVPQQYLTLERYNLERFPGFGVNANLYAFMLSIVLIFAFNAFLRGRASLVVAAFAFLAIVSSSSRLATVLGGAGCGLLWAGRWVSESRARRRSSRMARRLLLYAVLFAICAVPVGFVLSSQIEALWPKLVFVTRFSELLSPDPAIAASQPNDVQTRMYLWRLGMQRVSLAPILGIAPNIWENSETDVLLFSAPHNEFIFYWTAYGVAGLLAHLYLLGALVLANMRRRTGLVWLVLYGALFLQMMFDGAFQGVRFVALFFIVVGLNVTEWTSGRRRRRPHPGTSRPGTEDHQDDEPRDAGSPFPAIGGTAGSMGGPERLGGVRPA